MKNQPKTENTEASTADLNHKLSDFLVQEVGTNEELVAGINDFFNSTTIKSELHWFTHRDTLVRAAERDDRRLFYIAPGGHIIAGLMVWCESRVLEPNQAQIRLVAVDPKYRNHGIGSYLVAAATDFATSLNKSIMIADVASNSPAVKFWNSVGFTKTEEYETNGGRLMYRMERPLSTEK